MNFENKDYYNILGIKRDASMDSIRNAYYREKFENPYVRSWETPELDEAYSVLSDYDKRKEYDRYLLSKENNSSDVSIDTQNQSEERIDNESISPMNNNIGQSVDTQSQHQNNQNEEQQNLDNKKSDYNINTNSDQSNVESNSNEVEPEQSLSTNLPENQSDVSDSELNNDENLESTNDISSFTVVPINRNKKVHGKLYRNVSSKTLKLAKGIKKAIPILGVSALTFVAINVSYTIPIALVGSVAAGLLTKTAGMKLVKTSKARKIKSISTQETREIENYSKNLEEQIYDLLSRSNSNYNVEINKLKLENQIDLLKKRIEIKKNQNVDKCSATKYKLDLAALKFQLESLEERKEKIDEKINEMSEENIRESALSRLNDKVSEKTQEYNRMKASNVSKFKIKKLKKYNQRLLNRRDSMAKFIKFYNGMGSKVKDFLPDKLNNFKKYQYLFTPVEDVEEETFSKIR